MKFTGEITHLSQRGLGVVKNKQDNISYFVNGTWPGDAGEFEVIDKPLDNKKFAYARLIRLTRPSEHRQHPACPYINLNENPCTGCPWMIADYASQLEQKKKRFVYAMQRVGFDAADFHSVAIQDSPEVFGYRNRCQVKTDGRKLGFVSEQTGEIVAINDCVVLNEACRNLLKTAVNRLPEPSWYSDAENDWHFIDLDDVMHSEDIQIDRKRPFRQGNTSQNAWMQSWLREKLTRIPDLNNVVELFCGSGNFTRIIAESHCLSITAFETDPLAIRQLKSIKLEKVNAQVADLFKPLTWKRLRPFCKDADTLVLDPPRSGLKKHQGFFECFGALTTIIYISCNPETFARDAWVFKQHGWRVGDVQLVDQFPHTPHVEVLAVFVKTGNSHGKQE